ncbi:MAG: transposase [Chloroflexi bacterium]|nr:transposase [Chloroflexota bacterium]
MLSRPTSGGETSTWSFDRPGQETGATGAGKRQAQASHCRSHAGQAGPERSDREKLPSPAHGRRGVDHVRHFLDVPERRACRVLGQPRATQRLRPKILDDNDPLTRDITDLATRFGRYGCRRVTASLNDDGWHVNHMRVERIWRRAGSKVPKKQPKRGRLWLNDGPSQFRFWHKTELVYCVHAFGMTFPSPP